jgi:ABC-type amino acid transport substrate-binding protein
VQPDFPQLDLQTAISFTQFYAWGVNEASPALRDTLNAWLDSYMKTAEYKALKKKYFQ